MDNNDAAVIYLLNFFIGLSLIATGIAYDVTLNFHFPNLYPYCIGLFYIAAGVLGYLVYKEQQFHLHTANITLNAVSFLLSTCRFSWHLWNYTQFHDEDEYSLRIDFHTAFIPFHADKLCLRRWFKRSN